MKQFFLNQPFSKIYEREDLPLIIGLIPKLILFGIWYGPINSEKSLHKTLFYFLT